MEAVVTLHMILNATVVNSIQQCLENWMESRERSVVTLGLLCTLPTLIYARS